MTDLVLERSLLRRVLALLWTLVCTLGARTAAAQTPEPAALSWVRADGADACPAAPEIARRVQARLGRDVLVAPAQAALVVEAYIAPTPPGGFSVTIALTRDAVVVGRRELTSTDSSCREIADKAALTIALMIDPEAQLADASPEPTPAPPAPPEPARAASAAPPPKPPPAPPPARTRSWAGDVEVAVGAQSGLIPGLAPGVFARGRAWPPGFPVGLELEGAYFPKQTTEAEPGKTASFTLVNAGLALCSRPASGMIALSGCAGAQFGSISGRGSGFDYTASYQAWLFAVALRGRVWFRPTRYFALVAGPDLALPLKRDAFETTTPTTGTVTLWQVSPVAIGFEFGAVLEL